MNKAVNKVSNETSPIEDRNSPFVKEGDLDSQSFSESLERGDGYVVFSSKGPERGNTKIVLKWGGNPQNNKQQKDKGEKEKDQDKDKEKGDKGEETGEDGGEQDQGGQEGADPGGTGGSGRSKEGGREKDTQSDQRGGGGKGKDKGEKGEEEGGETEGDGEGSEKEGKERDGEKGTGQGGKERGEDGGDKDEGDEGGRGDGGDREGDLDPDKIRGQDILGRGRNRGEEPDDDEEGEPRRPPHGPRKRGKGKDKSKGKPRKPGEPGEPTDPEDDNSVLEVSSDITNVPPASDEKDPSVLDIIFDKNKKEVSQKENKVIHKSFVFRSGNKSIEVFRITPRGNFSVGDRTYIKKLANLVYYLYEPYLKAPNVDLDPSASVIDSPISSRGLRSGRPHERPRISYGALSALDQVDFSKLIVFIDVSGSMDMVMVSRVINSYFQSVFTALRKSHGKTVKALVVLHGTNVAVFGINQSWLIAAQTIAGVAESSRGLVGMMNGSESTLTHRIVDILGDEGVFPSEELGGIRSNSFINGQIPLIWITDFYWEINPGEQLNRFLRHKPALLISTVPDPEDAAKGLGDKADIAFSGGAFGTARTIMSKVPYGALIYFPSFIGSSSSGSFTPGSSSGGSTLRVYAKGGAYYQLLSRKDKLGQISIVRIR